MGVRLTSIKVLCLNLTISDSMPIVATLIQARTLTSRLTEPEEKKYGILSDRDFLMFLTSIGILIAFLLSNGGGAWKSYVGKTQRDLSKLALFEAKVVIHYLCLTTSESLVILLMHTIQWWLIQ